MAFPLPLQLYSPMEKIEQIAGQINLQEFQYTLPDDRIAEFPLAERDQSKLLHFQNGTIDHRQFFELTDLLPANSTLFFNNTKVIPARIKFFKETGAQIELFLLHPVAPFQEINAAMSAEQSVVWECMIGNKKRFKSGNELYLNLGKLILTASIEDAELNHIRFSWNDADVPFVEVVQLAGLVPLPPYIKRKAIEADKETYQTVYSKMDGAVAAPTAGLHFTPGILAKLEAQGHTLDYLTLHVGAGTFQPMKVGKVTEHPMHCEQVVVSKENLQTIIAAEGAIIPVGTTSMRTLESLYWYGVKLMADPQAAFFVEKLSPYQEYDFALPSLKESIALVLQKLVSEGKNELIGETEIFIFPSYQFKVCRGLITNFHQPGSTLILLVAALVGDQWKDIYQEALNNHYRFLSYGDSSLLLP